MVTIADAINGNKRITRFDQIPLRDFHKNEKCKPEGIFAQNFEGSMNDILFQRYATHMNKMMNNMNTNQDKLLNVLKKIFKFKSPEKVE